MLFRRHVYIAIVAIICVFGADSWSMDSSFVGVWRFVKEVDRRADGSVVQIGPSKGYIGLLIFSEDGYVSGQIYPVGRTWKPSTATREEFQSTLDFSTAGFGRYQIDLTKKQILIKFEGNLDPTQEGASIIRTFKFSGDTLILSGPFEYNGENFTFDITWSRERKH